MNFYKIFNKKLIFSAFLLFFTNNIFCMEPTPEEIRTSQIEVAKVKANRENLIFTPIEQIKTIQEYNRIKNSEDLKVGDDIYYYSQSQNKIEKVKIISFANRGGTLVSDSKELKKLISPFNILGKVRNLTSEELARRLKSRQQQMEKSITEEESGEY